MSETKEAEEIRNPAKERDTDRILKKNGDPITLNQLEEFLDLISWKLRHIGCDHYVLVNEKGERTNLEAREYSDKNIEIRLLDDEKVFGKSGTGNIYARLEHCAIRISTGSIYIIGGDEDKSGLSIHLYNFDDPFTEQELFINALPRDFEMRQKCSECSEISKQKSKPLSAFQIYKEWTMIVMGRALVTPKCHKCGTSTENDMNIHTELVIWDLKNECEVNFDHIKKIAEPLKSEYNGIARKQEKEKDQQKEIHENVSAVLLEEDKHGKRI